MAKAPIKETIPIHNPELLIEDSVADNILNSILSDGGLKFGLKLYNELKNSKNVFFSPFSIRVALAMTAAGAKGTTLTQMNSALELDGFQKEDDINRAFQLDLGSFSPNSDFTLSMANRIYIRKDFPIEASFKAALETYYLSSIVDADFVCNPSGVAIEINKWVEEQTDNIIKNLFTSDSFTPDTAVVVVNAIYFNGKWKRPFDPYFTIPKIFNLADGQKVKVPTMFKRSGFMITNSAALNSQILQLEYVGNRLAMHIILPKEGIDLSHVQKNLNLKNVNDYIDNFNLEEVEVYLPKFKASYKESLNGPLQSLGMVAAFGFSADLSRIASADHVWLSSVVHQAYVVMDEEETIAAAATGVAIPCATPEPYIQFGVDRPCIYLIYDLKCKQILFMGNLDDPTSESVIKVKKAKF